MTAAADSHALPKTLTNFCLNSFTSMGLSKSILGSIICSMQNIGSRPYIRKKGVSLVEA
ncbi:unnamed protein product [Meloidogyne enterolobii]|uniref:Uncharacterized protein n=1 Tax=Meloidogyne enterolobii TaxID=390850 RepID=A0ACB1AGV5_MELEN